MGRIFELLGEEIAGVDDARNVSNADDVGVMGFTHTVLVEVEMFGAFAGACCRPVDRCFVIVVNCYGVACISDPKVDSTVLDVKEFDDAGVGGDDFSLAQRARSLFLADGFPSYGATGTADDKSQQGAEFEHVEGSAIVDSVSKLAAPASVTEGSEVRAIRRSGGRGGIGVCLLVMVVGKMVKCLDCGICYRIRE